ncbi:hypothetical protein [Streptomyces niveus]|uniref:hypothetical protein n=1 Tax=Streptomyces niveus TaxID=193462 RepID=UPI00362C295E
MASLVRAVSWARLGRLRKTRDRLLLLASIWAILSSAAARPVDPSFDFAEPSFVFGFGDPVFEAVADLFEMGLL